MVDTMDNTVTITKDTEIILDGQAFLLESGDKILVSEGIGKILKRIALATIRMVWPKDMVNKFMSGETVSVGGKHYDPDDPGVLGEIIKRWKPKSRS